jgi:transposase-like protein
VIEGFGKPELHAFALGAVAPQTRLVTDDWPAYRDLSWRPAQRDHARRGSMMPEPPPANVKRWTPQRKAAVLAEVRSGAITVEEACRRYEISGEEFLAWLRAFDTPRPSWLAHHSHSAISSPSAFARPWTAVLTIRMFSAGPYWRLSSIVQPMTSNPVTQLQENNATRSKDAIKV